MGDATTDSILQKQKGNVKRDDTLVSRKEVWTYIDWPDSDVGSCPIGHKTKVEV